MNIDENIQKVINTILKKWKLLCIFAVIGAIVAFAMTAKFTTLTYTSTVEFLAYVDDSDQELTESTSMPGLSSAYQQASETSKMNYAMKMLNTYIEIFNTNEFNEYVADTVNKTYGTECSTGGIRSSITITPIENTAMFKMSVTTTDADLSYHIALCLAECVPAEMEITNQGLVRSSVEDAPLRAYAAESKNYPKKCLFGAVAGIILAALYAILRELLDLRIKGAEDLTEKYSFPVLGSVPTFEFSTNKKEGK